MYYDVWVSSNQYHGRESLSYSYPEILEPGQLVLVPLRNQQSLAVVVSKTLKPTFKTKGIAQVLLYKLPTTSLDLMIWMASYYPSQISSIASLSMPPSLARKQQIKPAVKTIGPKKIALPPLTTEQEAVLKQISQSTKHNFLLHGETGSGKTRIYLELAKQSLAKGQSVLVLTPEISLTPQLVLGFEQVFAKQVITIHSNLSDVERRDAWLTVLEAKDPVVVIGPRSALFAPFKSLGLIVIDEAHDQAYKQEQAPHYQAQLVAGKLAQLHNAQLVLGTATPNVTDYYIAQAKSMGLLRMQQPAVKTVSHKAVVEIINSRDRSQFTRDLHLSDRLLEAIKTALDNHEQSLVFLNRRGTARLVLCQVCGWQIHCPICDLPLTYHGDSHSLRCHTCGYKAEAVARCPVCSSSDIIYKSIGTKAIVELLARVFPKARIGRYDSDNTKTERFEQHYQQVSQGKVDILVGTQLLAKGLDLPGLSVVGVVTADTSLSFPDYTAEERTYQQLTQIIGRVGRGHRAGRAIIQTYNPDSPLIKAATHKNWEEFYKTQLAERQQFIFPPYCYLLKLSCVRKSQASASRAAEQLRKRLLELSLPVQIIGPAPSFYEKTRGGYRWQLVLKAKQRQHLLAIVKALPSNWSYDLDPVNLL